MDNKIIQEHNTLIYSVYFFVPGKEETFMDNPKNLMKGATDHAGYERALPYRIL